MPKAPSGRRTASPGVVVTGAIIPAGSGAGTDDASSIARPSTQRFCGRIPVGTSANVPTKRHGTSAATAVDAGALRGCGVARVDREPPHGAESGRPPAAGEGIRRASRTCQGAQTVPAPRPAPLPTGQCIGKSALAGARASHPSDASGGVPGGCGGGASLRSRSGGEEATPTNRLCAPAHDARCVEGAIPARGRCARRDLALTRRVASVAAIARASCSVDPEGSHVSADTAISAIVRSAVRPLRAFPSAVPLPYVYRLDVPASRIP